MIKNILNVNLVCRMLLVTLMLTVSAMGMAQKKSIVTHKVKKQETVFGISKEYGITIEELQNANPEMKAPDFVLKKGMKLIIPEHKEVKEKPQVKIDPLTKQITIGVMLPLHDINGDGKRMVEYYRGILLAISEMKRLGYSVTVNAWNVAEDDDIRTTLIDQKASKCNLIFGPLYTKQVRPLADFCMNNNIRLVIPFSINGEDVKTCPQIYQVYQSQADITAASIKQFINLFADTHPVFIDCNDQNSKKGDFTFGLRKQLEERGITYSITNINSSMDLFQKAFDRAKRNVVILNTGRSPELGTVMQKLALLKQSYSGIGISMFGYNEWFLYTKIYQEKFRTFDTYIPSTYDYNAESADVQRLEQLYLSYYHTPMQAALPRFAITGYDQAMFFLQGYRKYGSAFKGTEAQKAHKPVQTPYSFERIGNGGYQNRTFMLVHFK